MLTVPQIYAILGVLVTSDTLRAQCCFVGLRATAREHSSYATKLRVGAFLLLTNALV